VLDQLSGQQGSLGSLWLPLDYCCFVSNVRPEAVHCSGAYSSAAPSGSLAATLRHSPDGCPQAVAGHVSLGLWSPHVPGVMFAPAVSRPTQGLLSLEMVSQQEHLGASHTASVSVWSGVAGAQNKCENLAATDATGHNSSGTFTFTAVVNIRGEPPINQLADHV